MLELVGQPQFLVGCNFEGGGLRYQGGGEGGVGLLDGRFGPGFRVGVKSAEDIGDVLDMQIDMFGEGSPHSVFDSAGAVNVFESLACCLAGVV